MGYSWPHCRDFYQWKACYYFAVVDSPFFISPWLGFLKLHTANADAPAKFQTNIKYKKWLGEGGY